MDRPRAQLDERPPDPRLIALPAPAIPLDRLRHGARPGLSGRPAFAPAAGRQCAPEVHQIVPLRGAGVVRHECVNWARPFPRPVGERPHLLDDARQRIDQRSESPHRLARQHATVTPVGGESLERTCQAERADHLPRVQPRVSAGRALGAPRDGVSVPPQLAGFTRDQQASQVRVGSAGDPAGEVRRPEPIRLRARRRRGMARTNRASAAHGAPPVGPDRLVSAQPLLEAFPAAGLSRKEQRAHPADAAPRFGEEPRAPRPQRAPVQVLELGPEVIVGER